MHQIENDFQSPEGVPLYSAMLKKPRSTSPVIRISTQLPVTESAATLSKAVSVPIHSLISNQELEAKCRKKIAETVKRTSTLKPKIQVHQIQAVAPEILQKKPKPAALKVTIPAQGKEERKVSEQLSLDTIELDSLKPLGPQNRDGDDSDHPLSIEDTKEMETMETESVEPIAVIDATLMDTEPVAEPQPCK